MKTQIPSLQQESRVAERRSDRGGESLPGFEARSSDGLMQLKELAEGSGQVRRLTKLGETMNRAKPTVPPVQQVVRQHEDAGNAKLVTGATSVSQLPAKLAPVWQARMASDPSSSAAHLAPGNSSQVAQFAYLSQRGDKDGRRTEVTWGTASLLGDTVGVKMVAKLGPEHLQGGPPKGSAQKTLMANLPTETSLPANKKFVKGHLLNDHLGGPGDSKNLYPITAKANGEHEREIESKVKTWVNEEHRWVRYTVDITTDKSEKGNKDGFVDATLKANAALLNPDDSESGHKVSVEIESKKGGGSVEDSIGESEGVKPAADAGGGFVVKRSSRSKKDKAKAEDWVRGLIEYGTEHEEHRKAIMAELMSYKGIGAVTAGAVLEMKLESASTPQQEAALNKVIGIVGGQEAFFTILEGVMGEFDDEDS